MEKSALYLQHEELLNQAIEALSTRQFFSPYPEHPKAYDQELDAKGKMPLVDCSMKISRN